MPVPELKIQGSNDVAFKAPCPLETGVPVAQEATPRGGFKLPDGTVTSDPSLAFSRGPRRLDQQRTLGSTFVTSLAIRAREAMEQPGMTRLSAAATAVRTIENPVHAWRTAASQSTLPAEPHSPGQVSRASIIDKAARQTPDDGSGRREEAALTHLVATEAAIQAFDARMHERRQQEAREKELASIRREKTLAGRQRRAYDEIYQTDPTAYPPEEYYRDMANVLVTEATLIAREAAQQGPNAASETRFTVVNGAMMPVVDHLRTRVTEIPDASEGDAQLVVWQAPEDPEVAAAALPYVLQRVSHRGGALFVTGTPSTTDTLRAPERALGARSFTAQGTAQLGDSTFGTVFAVAGI